MKPDHSEIKLTLGRNKGNYDEKKQKNMVALFKPMEYHGSYD